MVIDSVVWAQCINVTDTHTDGQTDSHVATTIATITHRVLTANMPLILGALVKVDGPCKPKS